MNNVHFHVAVVGVSAAGLACAQQWKNQACGVTVFDPAHGTTIADIWHDDGWKLASREHCIWIPAMQVGLCGDWLCGGPEKDGARSGHALAARLLGERFASEQA